MWIAFTLNHTKRHPPTCDAKACIIGDSGFEESDGASPLLVGLDLGEADAGVIVDADAIKAGREILAPEGVQPQHARPIQSENRAILVASIARGRRWLDELIRDANVTAENIAKCEGCSARKVNMTISLAFLAPDLVRAAIEGGLPHGMGVTRLADLPSE
jgi:hypothetical protein